MANSENIPNILNIDAVGTVTTKTVKITGIAINASADTWAIELRNTANQVILDINQRSMPTLCKPLEAIGVAAQTLTNITRVILYTEN